MNYCNYKMMLNTISPGRLMILNSRLSFIPLWWCNLWPRSVLVPSDVSLLNVGDNIVETSISFLMETGLGYLFSCPWWFQLTWLEIVVDLSAVTAIKRTHQIEPRPSFLIGKRGNFACHYGLGMDWKDENNCCDNEAAVDADYFEDMVCDSEQYNDWNVRIESGSGQKKQDDRPST